MSEEADKRKISRSPKFPFISLSKAIERADQLRLKEGRYPVRMETAFADWGYSPKSSGAFQTVAALKMYGLLEDVAAGDQRKVKLTEVAWKFFLDERPEPRAAALKDFATKPKIMQELLSRWGVEPPSEAECRSVLKVELGFLESTASDVLEIYRQNIAYAGLATADNMSFDGADKPDEANGRHEDADKPSDLRAPAIKRPPVTQGTKQDIFSLPEGEVVLQWPDPLTKASFEDFESWVQLVLRKAKRSVKDEHNQEHESQK